MIVFDYSCFVFFFFWVKVFRRRDYISFVGVVLILGWRLVYSSFYYIVDKEYLFFGFFCLIFGGRFFDFVMRK